MKWVTYVLVCDSERILVSSVLIVYKEHINSNKNNIRRGETKITKLIKKVVTECTLYISIFSMYSVGECSLYIFIVSTYSVRECTLFISNKWERTIRWNEITRARHRREACCPRGVFRALKPEVSGDCDKKRKRKVSILEAISL